MEQIAELFELLGEARSPWPKRAWGEVESEIGVQLPSEYKAWGECYSTVSLGNSIVVSNFACMDGDLRTGISESLSPLEYVTQENGVDRVFGPEGRQYESEVRVDAFYPEVPGLLGWGAGVGGRSLMWYTDGHPDQWKIVVSLNDDDFHVFEYGFAEFLLRLVRNQLGPRLDSSRWLDDNTIDEMWGYRTASTTGIEFRAIDFRTIGTF